MQKKVSKVKTNIESKRKYRWILAIFAASTLTITPIIPLASCGGTKQDSSISQDTKKELGKPATKDNYNGSSDLSKWISEENARDIPTKISDLFTNNTLNTTNTNAITLNQVNSLNNQFTINVKLNIGYTIDGNDSWTSGNLTYKVIPSAISVITPTVKDGYKSNSDLTTWITEENKKNIVDQVTDLFNNKTLNTTNTKAITLTEVVEQDNQFTIKVDLNTDYLIEGKNFWVSQPLPYTDTSPKAVNKIEITKPELLNGNTLLGNLETIQDYTTKFNGNTNITEKINSLFGFHSSLSSLNTNSIDANIVSEKDNQIKFAITLNQGFTFKDSLGQTIEITCTYSRSLPTDFTIGAYGDNEQTYQTNFNGLKINEKIDQINNPTFTNNSGFIDNIEVIQQDNQYGYQVTLKPDCSFTTPNPISKFSSNSNITVTNQYFFPFNGTGKISKSIPIIKGNTITSDLDFDTYVNSIFPKNFSENNYNEVINTIFSLSGTNVYGLNAKQIWNLSLEKDPQKSQFTLQIDLNFGSEWESGGRNLNIVFNYIQNIQINPDIFYQIVVSSENQTIDQFIENFNKDAELQAKYLLKNPNESLFSQFTAEKLNDNHISLSATVKDQYDLYGTNIYKFNCFFIPYATLKNFFDSIPGKESGYIFNAKDTLNTIQLHDWNINTLVNQLGWTNTAKLFTKELRSIICLKNFMLNNNVAGSIQLKIGFTNVYLEDNIATSLSPLITINQYTPVTNVVNTFNAYSEEVNDIAKLVDTITKAFIVYPSDSSYDKITLKSILNEISNPLADFIIKYFGNLIPSDIPVDAQMIQEIIIDILTNQSINKIIKKIFPGIAGSFSNSENINKVLFTLVNLLSMTFKAINQTNTLIANSPIPSFIKQPVNYVLSYMNINPDEFTNLINQLMPLAKFMLRTNLGILDFLDSAISFSLQSNFIPTLLNNFQISIDNQKLSDALQVIANELFPFQKLSADAAIYSTDPENATQSTITTQAQQIASVGFDIKNCALRNEISPSEFINSFISVFFNTNDFSSKSSPLTSTVKEIKPEIIQTLSTAGIIISPDLIKPSEKRYVQFKLITTDATNPYLEMNITQDDKGLNPITDNVKTYISLKNLNANDGNKNWFGNQGYQGGLFKSSLYDKLLGNKTLLKAILAAAFSLTNKSIPPQASGLLNLIFKNNLVGLNLLDTSTSTFDYQKLLEGINTIIDEIKLNGKNVYDLIDSLIGKIEQTANSQFAEKWIGNNSPYTIVYDQLTNQYIYKRTYNFGTVNQTNGITQLDLTPLKTLLGGNFTVKDILNIAKLFLENAWWIDILNKLGSYSVESYLYDKAVIPGTLSFTETLIMNANEALNNTQNNINVNQTIDLTGMNEFFDDVFGLNVSGKNTKSKTIFNWGWFVSGIITGQISNKLVNKDTNLYIFDINTKTLNIRFIENKTSSPSKQK